MATYSHSKIGCYETCPRKYKFKYVEKIRSEDFESVEGFLGNRVHETLEHLYRCIQSGQLLTEEELLKHYKTISFFDYYLWYPFVKKMRTVRPLNYMPYIKAEALAELERTVGYKPYPRKHGESVFTKFFQNYYLPTKFGYDKRRPHLSSLIVSGQMTREEALAKLDEPLYDPQELEIDIAYFCKKLRISRTQFDELINAVPRHYTDFPTWEGRYRLLKRGQEFVERVLGKRVRVYS